MLRHVYIRVDFDDYTEIHGFPKKNMAIINYKVT